MKSLTMFINESVSIKDESLRAFMKNKYDNDSTCIDALKKLTDTEWLKKKGWFSVVFADGREGVASPQEGIVVGFDKKNLLPKLHTYHIYKFNPKTWKRTDGKDWDDDIYKILNDLENSIRLKYSNKGNNVKSSVKTRYEVTCTAVYNGSVEVEATSKDEALELAQKAIDEEKVEWNLGEATADYATEKE